MPELPKGTVTLLFCDIEGSTGLLEHFGDRYLAVLDEYRGLLRAMVEARGGHVVDTTGGTVFVAFGRAVDAVAAADAQRVLAAHHWPDGAVVRVRMGLHSGEPTLTDGSYVGVDVHRAARLCDAGHGG